MRSPMARPSASGKFRKVRPPFGRSKAALSRFTLHFFRERLPALCYQVCVGENRRGTSFDYKVGSCGAKHLGSDCVQVTKVRHKDRVQLGRCCCFEQKRSARQGNGSGDLVPLQEVSKDHPADAAGSTDN
ncbi:uncharacterized protein UBRO_20404 [Ustilago bromivora]|uniref:Uncharacterized protein n=1 Tax=Ustilago bromivora TaxID=307758 RepID=A0A1K0GVD0_9BASI|nr:uncharacterized protein UBRO_20404 [Ustilago bromivora]